jgi:hypothetical protein
MVAVCLTAPACRTTCWEAPKQAAPKEEIENVPTENETVRRMRNIIIPKVAFHAPDTISDAVNFFKQASREFDQPEIPLEERGIDFSLRLPRIGVPPVTRGSDDPLGGIPVMTNAVPVIPALDARSISLRDALDLVCDVTDMKFRILENGCVVVMPKDAVEPDCGLPVRMFSVWPSLVDAVRFEADERRGDSGDDGNTSMPAVDADQNWKLFFSRKGVTWPEDDGASITYLSVIGRLRVENTPENLDLIYEILEEVNVPLCLIDIDVQVVAFRPKDIERLKLAGGVTAESLTALRKRGKARLVSSASVVTKSGQEAVAKAVQEVLYPTELNRAGGTNRNDLATVGGAVVPGGFEMREVGMILQVVPEISSSRGRMINLMLNPVWTELNRWETYQADSAGGGGSAKVPFRQPVFGAVSCQTQVSVMDGETILLGGSSTPDGDWTRYVFLTAKRSDIPQQQEGTAK